MPVNIQSNEEITAKRMPRSSIPILNSRPGSIENRMNVELFPLRTLGNKDTTRMKVIVEVNKLMNSLGFECFENKIMNQDPTNGVNIILKTIGIIFFSPVYRLGLAHEFFYLL